MSQNILTVKNLNLSYRGQDNIPQKILAELSFGLKKNQCLGIVGESGSGKSMTAKAILGLLDKNFSVKGDVIFNNVHLLKANKRKIRKIRASEISMILQNPMTAFDPLFSIGAQMIETFTKNLKTSKKEAKKISIKALNEMQITDTKNVLKKYPHQLSGGMLQRVMIGISLSLNPEIIIADEPTTAVDAINVGEIMRAFKNIKENFNCSLIFISHDLGVVSQIADNVLIMKEGRIVEKGETEKILNNPENRHTKYLVERRNELLDKFYQVVGGLKINADESGSSL